MRLSEIQSKKVIDVTTGANIGTIMDAIINRDGKVEAFLLDQGRGFFSLTRESDVQIEWSHILKIGEDVIFVKKEP